MRRLARLAVVAGTVLPHLGACAGNDDLDDLAPRTDVVVTRSDERLTIQLVTDGTPKSSSSRPRGCPTLTATTRVDGAAAEPASLGGVDAHTNEGCNHQTFVGEALPHLGAQAVDTGRYVVWAPAAAKIDDQHWMLYYTAQLAGTVGKKCIWRAHASSPNGPFVDDYGGPITCESGSLWTIDPYLVKDESTGTWNLGARVDQPGGINTIQVRALGPLAQSFAVGSSWSELAHNAPTSWEQPVMEKAAVVRLTPPGGSPHWFVFYSGRAWDDDSYAVGYADCGATITGPCTKKTPNGPWLATDANAGVFGPGTPTFYTNGSGEVLMSVQAWQHSGGKSNPNNDGQIMRTYKVTIDAAYTPTATLLRVDL